MTLLGEKQIITNPVLPGSNPDPYMVRVGDDYYIATSTFEWFPGVAIYHSRDMVHWRLLTHPLTNSSQLNLLGVPSSGGIWAPNLTYHDGIYYLLYTNVVGRKGVFKDLHNYLITASDILGPWSEPVYLNAKGFDPALFHDDDGRKWLMQMRWDFRTGRARFSGIIMQEYDHAERRLVGSERVIYKGTEIGVTEGPSMFKKDGWYYLITAEGGTGRNHAVTVARARSLEGPFETMPDNPLMTTAHNPGHPLQNAGHAAFVQTQSGDWYISHLAVRELPDGRRLNPLGRETFIQRIVWTEEGWPKLLGGGKLPALEVAAPLTGGASFSHPYRSATISTLTNLIFISVRCGHLRRKAGSRCRCVRVIFACMGENRCIPRINRVCWRGVCSIFALRRRHASNLSLARSCIWPDLFCTMTNWITIICASVMMRVWVSISGLQEASRVSTRSL